MSLTPSQQFLLFWLTLLAGMVAGSYSELPRLILVWLSGIWLLMAVSGQKEPIESASIGLLGLSLGMLTWQLTGGETWANLGFVQFIGEKLTQLRDVMIDRVFLALPEPHGSLLTGIIFGNRTKLDKDLLEIFRVVGLSHIIAVSGYNLTILTKNVQTLLRGTLGRNALWVSLGIILFFVIITGAPASILRAAVMASTVIIAQLVGRPSRSVNLLVLAAGLLAVFEPKIIFEIGFQLSVAATYGLIRLAPVFNLAFRRLPGPVFLKTILAETLAATFITAPILIMYFERLSLVSPLTNILVLPLMPLLMGLGLVGVVALLVLPPIGKVVVLLTWPLLQWIISISTWFSQLPLAATEAHLAGWLTLILLAAMIVATEFLQAKAKQAQPDVFEAMLAHQYA